MQSCGAATTRNGLGRTGDVVPYALRTRWICVRHFLHHHSLCAAAGCSGAKASVCHCSHGHTCCTRRLAIGHAVRRRPGSSDCRVGSSCNRNRLPNRDRSFDCSHAGDGPNSARHGTNCGRYHNGGPVDGLVRVRRLLSSYLHNCTCGCSPQSLNCPAIWIDESVRVRRRVPIAIEVHHRLLMRLDRIRTQEHTQYRVVVSLLHVYKRGLGIVYMPRETWSILTFARSCPVRLVDAARHDHGIRISFCHHRSQNIDMIVGHRSNGLTGCDVRRYV